MHGAINKIIVNNFEAARTSALWIIDATFRKQVFIQFAES